MPNKITSLIVIPFMMMGMVHAVFSENTPHNKVNVAIVGDGIGEKPDVRDATKKVRENLSNIVNHEVKNKKFLDEDQKGEDPIRPRSLRSAALITKFGRLNYRLIDIKVANSLRGIHSNLGNVVKALDWIAGQNQNGNRIHVVYLPVQFGASNLPDSFVTSFRRTIHYLFNQGTSVVVPAGDDFRRIQDPREGELFPASMTETITVTKLYRQHWEKDALRFDLGGALGSNYGPSVDVAANPPEPLGSDKYENTYNAAAYATRFVAGYYASAIQERTNLDEPISARLVKWEMQNQPRKVQIHSQEDHQQFFQYRKNLEGEYGLEGTFFFQSKYPDRDLIVKLTKVEDRKYPGGFGANEELLSTYRVTALFDQNSSPDYLGLFNTDSGKELRAFDTQDHLSSKWRRSVRQLHDSQGRVLLTNLTEQEKVITKYIPVSTEVPLLPIEKEQFADNHKIDYSEVKMPVYKENRVPEDFLPELKE